MKMFVKPLKFYSSCKLLVASIAVSLSLSLTTTALAQYIPPADASAPSRPGTTTGRRGGCSRQAETVLTAIAPQAHVGQTVSSHPTFTWFMPDASPYPMEFRLYAYGSEGDRQLLYKTTLQTNSGFMQFSLPREQPGLLMDQHYGWQVVVFCNPNRPSSALVATAEIERVALPADLASTLAVTHDPVQRANAYAAAGLWYDAISEVLPLTRDSNAMMTGIRLLEDLAELEAVSNSEASQVQSERLQQIVELERQSPISTSDLSQ